MILFLICKIQRILRMLGTKLAKERMHFFSKKVTGSNEAEKSI
jgi:hypothetical protein